ncbi:MAG TPA: hypothetical protein VFY10_13215 [Dehalococcoidia bacterium]|nr:hypothetical protein [Dehalococcoidia bacterium]
MSLLSRFAKKEAPVSLPEISGECAHWELAPRWDCNADIGKKESVSSYRCTNCGKTMTPDEARSLSPAA